MGEGVDTPLVPAMVKREAVRQVAVEEPIIAGIEGIVLAAFTVHAVDRRLVSQSEDIDVRQLRETLAVKLFVPVQAKSQPCVFGLLESELDLRPCRRSYGARGYGFEEAGGIER